MRMVGRMRIRGAARGDNDDVRGSKHGVRVRLDILQSHEEPQAFGRSAAEHRRARQADLREAGFA